MITISDLLLQLVLGFCVTAGFAILFNMPRHVLIYAALAGAIGHVIRFTLKAFNISNEFATFCGAFSVGLIGYGMARRFHSPRLLFTVTGIISMVPGIPAFEMIIYFSHSDTLNGLQSLIRATLSVGAIATGLTSARLITDNKIDLWPLRAQK